MKVRISQELSQAIKKTAQANGMTISEIARRCLRSWQREGCPNVGIKNGDDCTTYGGTVVTVDVESTGQVDASTVRHVMAWRLRQIGRDLDREKFKTPYREGVDYVVVADATA